MNFKYYLGLILIFFNLSSNVHQEIFKFFTFVNEVPKQLYFDLIEKENRIMQHQKKCINFNNLSNPFKFAMELKLAANNNLYLWIYDHYKNNPFKINVEWSPNKNYLHSGFVLNDPFLVALLIRFGIDINKTSFNGYTPLILACRQQKWETCEVLISAGADVDLKDKFGKTALIYAMLNDAPENIVIAFALRSKYLLDSLKQLCSDFQKRDLIVKSFEFVKKNHPKLIGSLKKYCIEQVKNENFICPLCCDDEDSKITVTECCYNFIGLECLQKSLGSENNKCPYCRAKTS
ncbi:ankyrin repeat domain-containing protein [Candidatus Dependentiae bacterium]|nr:ankyrin repeat domain-containing protein [Candidatus Dependentiae bacterium]